MLSVYLMSMHAIVKVIPGGGWAAQVQYHEDEELDSEPVEAWLREELKRVLPFQESRGGGLFLLVIPDDAVNDGV